MGIEKMEQERISGYNNPYREISRDVYVMEVGTGISRANVYFVRTGASWVLIDAGLANCGLLIRKTAAAIVGNDSPPDAILLTHYHPDHAGSAVKLADFWGCPVYVHPDELPVTAFKDLSAVQPYANPLDRWVILPIMRMMPQQQVKEMLADTNVIRIVKGYDPNAAPPGLPDWESVHTPGHTPGHTSYFRSSDRVLITGDAVVTADLNSLWGFLLWTLRKNRQKISGPPWYSTWNWQSAKASVAALAKLEPRVIASGHGEPVLCMESGRALQTLADHL